MREHLSEQVIACFNRSRDFSYVFLLLGPGATNERAEEQALERAGTNERAEEQTHERAGINERADEGHAPLSLFSSPQ